jgi:hypothetical protein
MDLSQHMSESSRFLRLYDQNFFALSRMSRNGMPVTDIRIKLRGLWYDTPRLGYTAPKPSATYANGPIALVPRPVIQTRAELTSISVGRKLRTPCGRLQKHLIRPKL